MARRFTEEELDFIKAKYKRIPRKDFTAEYNKAFDTSLTPQQISDRIHGAIRQGYISRSDLPEKAVRVRTSDRIGQSHLQNCGLMAEVIAYRSDKDIDVLLENGETREHASYKSFISGYISPKDYRRKNAWKKCGFTQEMIDWMREHRSDDTLKNLQPVFNSRFGVDFNLDKLRTICRHYGITTGKKPHYDSSFRKDYKHNQEFINSHEKEIQNFFDANADKYTLDEFVPVFNAYFGTDYKRERIRYLTKSRFKASFVDKTTAPEGSVRNLDKNYDSFPAQIKINGKWIPYQRYIYEKQYGSLPSDVTVVFLNGCRTDYRPKNLYPVPKEDILRINARGVITDDPEINLANIEIFLAMDDIKDLEKGTAIHGDTVTVRKPEKPSRPKLQYHIGEKRLMNCRIPATVKTWHNKNYIDILFDDGVLITHKSYSSFKRGFIAHPGISPESYRRIDEDNLICEGKTV